MDVALLIVVVLVFRSRYGPGGSIEHYLPEKKELPMLIALLVLLYVVLGLAIHPQNIPDIEKSIAIIWAIYAAVIPLHLFIMAVKEKGHDTDSSTFSLKSDQVLLFLAGVLLTAAVFSTIVRALSLMIIVLFWIAGIVLGLFILVDAIR